MGIDRSRFLQTTLLVLSILTTVMVNGALGQGYCPASGSNTSYEWIESIAIGTTLNGFGSQGGYADFTEQTTIDLAAGEHDVVLTPGFGLGAYLEYWRIWIDLDQNGLFEESELLYSGSARGTLNGQIMIPDDALGGDTRMRIAMEYGGQPLACGPFTYGEVEDYTVHIQGGAGTDPGGESDYCPSNGNITSYEWIEGVAIGAFSHNSGDNDGYADYTGQVVTLGHGSNDLSLIPGFGYSPYNEYWQVWVDLNQDGVFAPEEILFSGNSQGTLNGEMVVPPDTPEGSTRMRISMKWGALPPACGSFTYGEVEDYTVRLGTEPPPAPTLGQISSMAAGSDPEIVYAVDQDNQALYFISTAAQQIVETVALPDAQPVAMAYANADNNLYIVSGSSGAITVFDLDTSQISQIMYSGIKTGIDIAVAPTMRRIFVLSPNGYDAYLTVVDMDSGAVVLEDMVSGTSIALDENSRMIFIGDSGLSPATMHRYYVGNDGLQLMQSIQAGSNGRRVNISPDGRHVVYPCGGGNGAGYTIYDFDSTNLNNVFGEWDVGIYPKNAVFSPNSSILFGTNGSPYDNYLYVMDAATYQEITKLDFPNSEYYAVFTPNSDGTVVVGFSYDSYYDDDYSLYFFTDTIY